MRLIEIAFWISFGIVFYAFLGYGIVLYLLVKITRLFGSPVKKDCSSFEPEVTIVIPCFNEDDILENKIVNCKELDYPTQKLSIVFITDGSNDNSQAVLQSRSGILNLHENRRAGKTAAENRAMKFIRTPFVIFSDANTMVNKDAVRNIMKHFADEKVGCVSGEKRIINTAAESASAAGEGIYWKYESLLKRLDSELYSTVGAAGELVAFRTKLYTELPEDTILDDFMQSMQIAAEGYKIVYEPEAYALEMASANVSEELKRKVRICAGGWQSIRRLSGKMRFTKTPLLYFQYISHRVLRWTIIPFLLILVFCFNMLLVLDKNSLYQLLIVFQLSFYLASGIGFIMENKRIRFKLFFVPYYFFIMNYAVLAGLKKYLLKEQQSTWDKVQRKIMPLNS